MATRGEMCCRCYAQLRVPLQAQAICCPYCRSVTHFQPNNIGFAALVPNQYTNYEYYPTSNYGYHPQSFGPSQQVSPPPVHGRKRAVLCGISYRGQAKPLKGSVNDVISMKYFLVQRMGFPHECILVLTEDEKHPSLIPTKHNIRVALNWLVQGSQSGDSLVFHYSGHARKELDLQGDEIDGYDESLCPLDYETQGSILDDEINAIIIRPLPFGAKLHAIIDTCYSGTFVDLPFMCRMNRQGFYNWEDHRISANWTNYKGTSGGLGICFSACDDHQHSGDTTAFTGNSTGAMTYSFIKAVETGAILTYGSLLNAIRNKIHEAQRRAAIYSTQEAQLSSTEMFDIHTKTFTL